MKIVAILVGILVALTLLWVVQTGSIGEFTLLFRSGVLGIETVVVWFIILAAGPVASLQLWRLRRMGLFLTAILCGLAFIYFAVGLFLQILQNPDAPRMEVFKLVLLTGTLLALLMSPAARRSCV